MNDGAHVHHGSNSESLTSSKRTVYGICTVMYCVRCIHAAFSACDASKLILAFTLIEALLNIEVDFDHDSVSVTSESIPRVTTNVVCFPRADKQTTTAYCNTCQGHVARKVLYT